MIETTRVRWGILGPGGVARDFFAGAAGSATGVVTALGTRNPANPALSSTFPSTRIHDGYDSLLADPQVDAVYIATPHPMHAQWAIAAARSGKHVLCEKPMGMNAHEVEAMFEAARAAGTFMGEAFMYRFHPLTRRILDLLAEGAIGELRMIKSSMGFALSKPDPQHRLLSPALGGGAILDVGGYPLSMARLLAGYRSGGAPLEPDDLRAVAHVGQTGVDEWSTSILTFPNGILAALTCSISLWQDNILYLLGTTGRMEIERFWFAGGKAGGPAAIRLVRHDQRPETITVNEPAQLYTFQFEAANAAIAGKKPHFTHPGMSAADSIANARWLDRWLAEVRGGTKR